MTLSARILDFLKRHKPWNVADEIPLTVAAAVFFFLSGFVVSVVNAFLDYENPFAFDPNRVTSYDPLLNLLYSVFKELGLPKKLPDRLISCAVPISLLRIALGRNHACLLLRRISWIMGMGFFIRVPFTLMTMLPNPNPECIPNPDPDFLLYAWKLAIQQKESCGDVVFSGHTIPFISTALIWVFNPVPYFTRFANYACMLVVSIFSFLSILALIAARYHYTLDCVLSAGTMYIIWKLYYLSLSQKSDYWLYSLVQFLDGGNRYSPDALLPTTEEAFQK